MTGPANPAIYHILHVDRLPSVIAEGGLLCDTAVSARSLHGTVIGMGNVKRRRMTQPVYCHDSLMVAECVPFYLCSRSYMLYVIHMANHDSLAYRHGQGPIVHLEADMREAASWADANARRWAFSLGNAASPAAEFRCDLAQLGEINWNAVHATNFRPPEIKEGKQAEFLVEGFVPWSLFRRIGVIDQAMAQQVANAIAGSPHRPRVEVQRGWYY
jgi:hypothetical protein